MMTVQVDVLGYCRVAQRRAFAQAKSEDSSSRSIFLVASLIRTNSTLKNLKDLLIRIRISGSSFPKVSQLYLKIFSVQNFQFCHHARKQPVPPSFAVTTESKTQPKRECLSDCVLHLLFKLTVAWTSTLSQLNAEIPHQQRSSSV